MALVLKHVERTKSGGYQSRRRVPKDVAAVITRGEFKRKLGDSEKETLKAWPECHALAEREIAEANLLWVSNFTYVSKWQGFVYVVFVIDTFADRIVGWQVSRSAKTDFVLDALE